jgi:hypothetical protein
LRYSRFPRAMQITYAPIELLQSILRRLSIALHLVFELTDASALPRRHREPPLGWRALLRVLAALRILCATGHHDLLREDELVDFLAVVPRLDGAEADDVFFAAGRGRLGVDSLDVDFFAAGRGRLDVCAVGADFFAGPLAGGPEADRRSEP